MLFRSAALGTIAAMLGTEVNEAVPILEGRLPLDGSRVEGAVPPVSPDGPSMSIRKHASAVFPLSRYIEEGRIPEMSNPPSRRQTTGRSTLAPARPPVYRIIPCEYSFRATIPSAALFDRSPLGLPLLQEDQLAVFRLEHRSGLVQGIVSLLVDGPIEMRHQIGRAHV